MKQPRPHDFLPKTKTKASLVPNWNHEIKKKKTRTQHVQTIIQQNLIAKRNKIRMWQENVPKTDVEHTKGNGEFYLYLYL
jgi:hypothetical protein